MRCSTSITAIEPRSARMRSPSSRTSSAPRPPAGSSSSSSSRLADERAGERDALLHRVGKRRRQPRRRRPRSRAPASVPSARSRSARSSRSERGRPSSALSDPRPAEALRADHHVLEHRQPGEQPDALQRARDAESRRAGWCAPSRASGPAIQASPTVGAHKPADHVEQGRLAGAVGTDDAEHLARRDLDRDVVERGDAAEADRQLTRGKRGTPIRGHLSSDHACKLYPRSAVFNRYRFGSLICDGGPDAAAQCCAIPPTGIPESS